MKWFWNRVPEVSKPFNPEYQEIWAAMSPSERKKSFVIDIVAFVVIGVIIWWVDQ